MMLGETSEERWRSQKLKTIVNLNFILVCNFMHLPRFDLIDLALRINLEVHNYIIIYVDKLVRMI